MTDTDSTDTRTTPARDNSPGRQGWVNRFTRAVLRSPLHPMMSRKLTLLYVTGRKSGVRYAVPTAFTDHAGQVLVASGGTWVRNLSGSPTVELRHHGRRILATAEVAEGRDRAYEIALDLLPPNPILRNFMQVGLGDDGRPKEDEFDAARERGVAFIALHPVS